MPLFKIQVDSAEVSLECSQSFSAGIRSAVFSAIIKSTPQSTKIHYRILTHNDRLYLYRNNRLTHRNRQSNRIIYALEWQIVNDLVIKNPTALKFHAAALAWHNSGLIFCGAPSSGKTSLSILLMQNGWQFLSDEFAFLNPNQRLIPFPRNLIIKPHLQGNIPIPADSLIFRVDDDHGAKQEAYYLSPKLFGTVSPKKLIIPTSFIFLENHERGGFRFEPLAHYAAFRLLMQHLFNPQLLKRERLDPLLNLLNAIPVYSLKIASPLNLPPAEQQTLVKQLIQIINHD